MARTCSNSLHRILAAFFATALTAAAASGVDFRCPPSQPGEGGRPLPLVERPSGVWRVGDPIPFVFGHGRFWRLVCAYEGGGEELEAVAHWVDRSHEDGRLMLEGLCTETPIDGEAALLTSPERQAKVRATSSRGSPPLELARQMLAAVSRVAEPCPGTRDAPKICSSWRLDEWTTPRPSHCLLHQDTTGAAEDRGSHRYIYRAECFYGSFRVTGTFRRVAPGQFERTYENPFGQTVRVVYSGELETGGVIEGTFYRESESGERGTEHPFEARCLDEP